MTDIVDLNTTDKSALRTHFAALRDDLPPDERQAAEAAIRDRLFSLPVWKDAPLICGYMSMRSEIDMMPVWKQAVTLGKAYALPVTVTGAREGRMIFRRLSGYTPHELAPARFGLSEPTPACPPLHLRGYEGALILVPGLAFDDGGFRIGYGGGYYDRFLTELKAAGVRVTTVGLVPAVCRTPALPREAHDCAVDIVICERSMTVTHGIQ